MTGILRAIKIDAIAEITKFKTSANRIYKSLSYSQLKGVINNLQAALKVAETWEAEKDNRWRAAKIKKLSAMMAKLGLSPSDIVDGASRKPGKKSEAIEGFSKIHRRGNFFVLSQRAQRVNVSLMSYLKPKK